MVFNQEFFAKAQYSPTIRGIRNVEFADLFDHHV